MRIWVSQLRKGLVELCVMGALRDVYPILARLAKDDLVEVRMARSPSGPPRRYYRLTLSGRKRLKEMSRHWTDFRTAVDSLL